MNKKLLFFVWSVLLFSANQTFGQIELTTGQSVDTYVDKIIGNGITYSNVYITGNGAQIATYTGGEVAGLQPAMDNGLVLSTGYVDTSDWLQGSASTQRSDDTGGAGITELNTLAGVPATYDGIILGFDFIPATDKLKINFSFGSEEYGEYVNTSYTDQLAIFISGPGFGAYPGPNIAVGPNGILVNSNTINRGTACPANTTVNCNSSNPIGMGNCYSNPMYYIDNCSGAYNNVMDGFTVMLQAQADVIAGEQYHIRIMIADVEDGEYDSWLLLQEGGFYADGAYVNAHIEYAYGGTSVIEGCSGNQLVFCLDEPLLNDHVIDIVSVTGTATEFVDYLPFSSSYVIPAGETCVAVDIVTLLDGVIEPTETIIIEYQQNMTETAEIVIEIHDHYEGCCYPDMVFDAPTGEPQQTLTQGQTLADLVISGESGADYFVWFSDADLTTEIPSTTQAIDQTTYYVIQVVGGCESDALAITVEVTLSNTIFDGKSFTAYPNPVRDIFNISYSNEITGIEVTNMLGQTLISETKNATDIQIDMSALPTGNYLVKVKTDEMIKVIKVVKQ